MLKRRTGGGNGVVEDEGQTNQGGRRKVQRQPANGRVWMKKRFCRRMGLTVHGV